MQAVDSSLYCTKTLQELTLILLMLLWGVVKSSYGEFVSNLAMCYLPSLCHPCVSVQSLRVVEALAGLEVMQGSLNKALYFLLGICLMVSRMSSLSKCCTTILAVALQCRLLLTREKNPRGPRGQWTGLWGRSMLAAQD